MPEHLGRDGQGRVPRDRACGCEPERRPRGCDGPSDATRAWGVPQVPAGVRRLVLVRDAPACGGDPRSCPAGWKRPTFRGGNPAPADGLCGLPAAGSLACERRRLAHRDADPVDRADRGRDRGWGVVPCDRAVPRAVELARAGERPAAGEHRPGPATRGDPSAGACDAGGALRVRPRVVSAVRDCPMTRSYPATARKRSIMFSTSKLVEALRSISRMACRTI